MKYYIYGERYRFITNISHIVFWPRGLSVVFFLLMIPGNLMAAEIRIGGEVELDHFTYAETPDDNVVNGRNQASLQLELEGAADYARLFSATEFRFDESDPTRDRTYVKELYVDVFGDNVDLRVGRQIITWGKADAFNPTDNLTPYDFSDMVDTDDERLGTMAFKADYYIGDVLLQAIVQPTFTPNTLPPSDSRWQPELPAVIADPDGAPGNVAVSYELLPEEKPDESELGKYALKLAWTLAGWDFSGSYLRGWANTSGLRELIERTAPDSVNVGLQQVYYKHEVLGLDFTTTIGKTGIRGEVAHFTPEHDLQSEPAIGRPYTQYSFGIDRTFSNVVGSNDLYVLAEVIGDTADEIDSVLGDYLRHPFREAAAFKIEYQVGYTSTWSIESIFTFNQRSSYIRPKFTNSFSDNVQFEAWLDILDGEEKTLFGEFSENDRVQLRLKYNF